MDHRFGSSDSAKHFDLKGYLVDRRERIDRALKTYLDGASANRSEIITAMTYTLQAGGKRLRPILCLAASHAAGGREEDALPAACAMEMIHTYSLIHDDLPAMDDDDLRRGKPTCHKAFSEATAILAGDALLTQAFHLLGDHALRQDPGRQTTWLAIIALLAQAAGHEGMIEGQMRDIASEGRPLGLHELEQLHRLKTGALISAAVRAGALIGEADDTALDGLERYGQCLGLAFQVVDDILNQEGDPHLMGKAVGTDQFRQKNTYPALLGLAGAKAKAADLVNQSLRSLAIFDNKADPLRAIARYVIERQR
jgi:geranylgeranyl diphosphate synthase type II